MIRCQVVLVAVVMLSGCHCQQASDSTRPRDFEAGPLLQASSGTSLSEQPLEGIMPLNWRQGMKWRVAVTAWPRNYRVGGPASGVATEIYAFLIVGVPGTAERYFRVEMRNERFSGSSPVTLLFRPGDGSLVGDDGPNHHSNPEQPFVETMQLFGVLAFPVLQAPLKSPYTFVSRTDGARTAGTQTIHPSPGGVDITIEIAQAHYVDEGVIEWRRGEPWPSSVRLWRKDRDDEPSFGGGSAQPVFVAASELLR